LLETAPAIELSAAVALLEIAPATEVFTETTSLALLEMAPATDVLTERILLASAVALLERTLAIDEISAPTRLVADAILLLAAARTELLLSSALLRGRVGAAAARATSTEKVYPVFMMKDVVKVGMWGDSESGGECDGCLVKISH
jgi:hypothetical protein